MIDWDDWNTSVFPVNTTLALRASHDGSMTCMYAEIKRDQSNMINYTRTLRHTATTWSTLPLHPTCTTCTRVGGWNQWQRGVGSTIQIQQKRWRMKICGYIMHGFLLDIEKFWIVNNLYRNARQCQWESPLLRRLGVVHRFSKKSWNMLDVLELFTNKFEADLGSRLAKQVGVWFTSRAPRSGESRPHGLATGRRWSRSGSSLWQCWTGCKCRAAPPQRNGLRCN